MLFSDLYSRDRTEELVALINSVVPLYQAQKLYRPIACIILASHDGSRYFLGKQDNPEKNWSPTQGCIWEDERFNIACFRELNEELHLEAWMLEVVSPVLLDPYRPLHIPFHADRTKRNGYAEGEAYFCCGMRLTKDAEIVLKPDATGRMEIEQTAWLSADEAIRYAIDQPGIATIREETRMKGRLVVKPAIEQMQEILKSKLPPL